MNSWTWTRPAGKRRLPALLLASIAIAALCVAFTAGPASARTQADVDAAIANGVTSLVAAANTSDVNNIHWDASADAGDIDNTGFALAAIGAAYRENPNDVTPDQLALAKKAVAWLISNQHTANDAAKGSWGDSSGGSNSNYATSIALMALSFFSSEPGAADAISLGRNFEIMWQNAPSATTGNGSSTCTAPSGGSYGNCGSWTYGPTNQCCGDTSNTGFGVTGLDFSGGVPDATAQANLGWTRAIQEINTNPFATLNDGGGSYLPGFTPGNSTGCCRSSANNTGTLLFSYAYDNVAESDTGVQAAMKLDTDILDVLELVKGTTPRKGVHHFPPAQVSQQQHAFAPGSQEDGSCTVGAGGCDWFYDNDGGYHYALFAISKGLGSYITADISDASNFYAKVADLLLTEQANDGSWPADLRDDGSPIGSTSFAILALAKAGQRKAVVPPAATAPAPAQQNVLPAAISCRDVRRFKFGLHHARHQRVVKAKVFVNGRLVKTAKGRNLKTLTIATLPQQSFVVKIVAYQSSGSRITSTRTYSGCTKSKPKVRAHHHKRHSKKKK